MKNVYEKVELHKVFITKKKQPWPLHSGIVVYAQKGTWLLEDRILRKHIYTAVAAVLFLIPIDFIVMLWGFQCPHISLGQTYIILSHPTVQLQLMHQCA